jgi:hypothetical protein
VITYLREWRRRRVERRWLESELHDFMHRNNLTRYNDRLCARHGCDDDDSAEWWNVIR